MIARQTLAARTRAAILSAARRLFARQGFAGTAVREIAMAAGVSKALIYHHFRDKDRLFSLLLAQAAGLVRREVVALPPEEPPVRQMARLILQYLRFVESHPDLLRLLLREEAHGRAGRVPALLARLRREEQAAFEAVIRRGVAAGAFKEVDPAVSASAVASAVRLLAAALAGAPHLTADGRRPPAVEVAANALDILLNGLARRPYPRREVEALLTDMAGPTHSPPRTSRPSGASEASSAATARAARGRGRGWPRRRGGAGSVGTGGTGSGHGETRVHLT